MSCGCGRGESGKRDLACNYALQPIDPGRISQIIKTPQARDYLRGVSTGCGGQGSGGLADTLRAIGEKVNSHAEALEDITLRDFRPLGWPEGLPTDGWPEYPPQTAVLGGYWYHADSMVDSRVDKLGINQDLIPSGTDELLSGYWARIPGGFGSSNSIRSFPSSAEEGHIIANDANTSGVIHTRQDIWVYSTYNPAGNSGVQPTIQLLGANGFGYNIGWRKLNGVWGIQVYRSDGAYLGTLVPINYVVGGNTYYSLYIKCTVTPPTLTIEIYANDQHVHTITGEATEYGLIDYTISKYIDLSSYDIRTGIRNTMAYKTEL